MHSIHNLRAHVNPYILLPDFNRLSYPYHSTRRVCYTKDKMITLPHLSNYPEFKPLVESGGEEMLQRSVKAFAEYAKLHEGEEVMIHAQRFQASTKSLYRFSRMETPEWYKENFKTKGILCLSQHGLEEGIIEYRTQPADTHQWRIQPDTHQWRIQPAEMLILRDGEKTRQRYRSFHLQEDGYLDMLTFIY